MHHCIGYLAISLIHKDLPTLTALDIQLSNVSALQPLDLLPSNEDLKLNTDLFHVGTYDILMQYCPEAMTYTKTSGAPLKPIKVMALHKLEPGKTLVRTRPGYDKNEAEIAEMSQLLWDIAKDVGIDREMMWDKKIIFKGDWLTVRNIVYQSSLIATHYSLAIKLQSESSFGAQLDHIEPVPGLFHFQMAIVNLYFGHTGFAMTTLGHSCLG